MKKYGLIICFICLSIIICYTAFAAEKTESFNTVSAPSSTPSSTLPPNPSSLIKATPKPLIKSGQTNSNKTTSSLAASTPSITGVAVNSTQINWTVVYPTSGIYGNRLELYKSGTGWSNITPDYYTANGTYSSTNLTPGHYMGRLTYLNGSTWVTLDNWVALSVPEPSIIKIKSTNNSITWKAVYEVSGQWGNKLEYWNSTSGWQNISNSNNTLNGEYTSANLLPNQTYMGRLTYYHSVTASYVTKDIYITTNKLSSPLNVSVVKSGITTAKVSWAEPEDTRGLPLTYSIYDGTTLLGTTTDKTFEYTATPFQTYTISIKASDSSGASAGSTPVIVNLTSNQLTAPLNVSVVKTNATTARVSWSEPEYTRGYAPTYSVYNGTILLGTTTNTTFDFTITNFVTYTIIVKASDPLGTSTNSTPVIINLTTDQLTAPRNVTAIKTGINTAKVSWSEPEYTRAGKGITYYIYNGTTQLRTTAKLFVDITTTPFVTYTFSVKASDSIGTSAASVPITVKFFNEAVYIYTNGRLTSIVMNNKTINYYYNNNGSLTSKQVVNN
ncbi:fibronectin type III domain-containing protein [Cohnella sp. GCM10012308]|uniref:fibronectin type III domain-containing protein n=1 Tax=Cohnella sp. GCM10012308 TaxID=3317329 RepID=UPI0036093478